MKKIWLGLLIGICFLSKVSAKETPLLSLGEYETKPNQNVKVNLTLKNNPGFQMIGVKIRYDSKGLEYIDSKVNGLEDAQLKDITINDYKTITFYALNTTKDKLIKDNGVIAEINFKVKQDNGSIPIKMEVTDFGTLDTSKLDFKKKDGNVKIITDTKSGKSLDLSKDKSVQQKINQAKLEQNSQENQDEEEEESKDDVIIWQTSDKKIASVDKNGKVTFHKGGFVTIKAVSKNGDVVYEDNFNVQNKVNDYLGVGLVLVVTISAIVGIIFKIKLNKAN